MPTVPRLVNWLVVAIGFGLVSAQPAGADLIPLASYLVQDSLAAEEAGRPVLAAVDPLGQSGFQSATFDGQTRQVYHFDGTDTQQGGLALDTTGLVAPDNYSIEMVVAFDRDLDWRRILDTSGRLSDNGFYLNPNGTLDVYDVSPHPGSTVVTAGLFHHIVLTNAQGVVRVYLNGVQELALGTRALDIVSKDNLLNLFLDNTAGTSTSEYSSGSLGLLRVYDGALDASQVSRLAAQPFAAVPEPSGALLLGSGLVLGLLARVRRRPGPVD